MVKLLKWVGILAGLLVIAVGGLLTWAHFNVEKDRNRVFAEKVSGMDSLVAVADVALGERIVNVRNGCIDCHATDLAGRTFLSDPAMGSYHSANLTPYGLKEWTNDEIANAIHFGIGRDGKPLQFMPALEFNALSKQDLASVIAYLRQLPEVERDRQPITIGPLAKVLYSFDQIPALLSTYYLDLNKDFSTKPVEAPTKEFGSYLANSACIGCHNPQFSGGPIQGAPPEWAAAADIRFGTKGDWTEEKFMQCMLSGVSPTTGETMKFPMPVNIVKNMNETELKALWAYLSTL
jgi:mono/diheme cytochrome c family protein